MITAPLPRPRPLLRVVLTLSVVASAAACSRDDEPEAATGCASTVREASLAVEVDEQIALLDVALSQCISAGALIGEMSRDPGIVGYSPATYVELRCSNASDDVVLTSAVCTTYRAPSTTVPVVAPSADYVALTLDGRSIVIVPDVDAPFVGAVPEPMQRNVDIAVEQGCIGVIANATPGRRRSATR